MDAELNVLMVEDNPDDADLIIRQLEDFNGWKINYTRVDAEPDYKRELLNHPWDMILCDRALPKFSGARAKQIYDNLKLDIPFHWVTGTTSPESAEELVRAGRVNALINKDYLLTLIPAVENGLQTAENYKQMILAWGEMLEVRDKESQGHSDRVTELSVDLARAMGVEEPDIIHIRRGARLHDVGKMGIADSILFKAGPLTLDEWPIMKSHVQIGYDRLKKIPFLKNSLEIPLYHHESFDGTGYPRGLRGEEIPRSARIFKVVDVYDALISTRPYKEAMTKTEALDWMEGEVGRLFDGRVFRFFREMMEGRE